MQAKLALQMTKNNWTLLKFDAFADSNISFAKILISVFDRTEEIVGNREFAGYQHFLFLKRFQSVFT